MSLSKKVFLIILSTCIGKFSFSQFSTSPGNIVQQSSGTVAIGFPIYTPSTQSLLQVKNGSVLFDGTTGNTPMIGAGTRMMWIPAKSAFRSGAVNSTQWDDINIGQYSIATGINSIASGLYSVSMGSTTTASGNSSFAAGFNTIASGIQSTSLGYYTKAQGSYSTAIGNRTTASGNTTLAIGYNTTAQSFSSFVLGQYNISPGTYSTTSWVPTDPLFVIGNGTSTTVRNNALTVLKNGNVLIDKATQVNSTYKLDVNGKMRALEIVVNTTGADFVFENDYELMPLNVLEQKIKADKHLPEIASATEMQENGVGLGELNTKLLQKTEELTLYIIELNKRIEELERKQK